MYSNFKEIITDPARESGRLAMHPGFEPDNIYRDICAFANDYYLVGGGHIIIGTEQEKGILQRPKGLSVQAIDTIQCQMEALNRFIRPVLYPQIFVEKADEGLLMILWVPAGVSRPYYVPEQITDTKKQYYTYIRRNALTVKASSTETKELSNRHSMHPASCHNYQNGVAITGAGLSLQSCTTINIYHQYYNHPKGSGAIPGPTSTD